MPRSSLGRALRPVPSIVGAQPGWDVVTERVGQREGTHHRKAGAVTEQRDTRCGVTDEADSSSGPRRHLHPADRVEVEVIGGAEAVKQLGHAPAGGVCSASLMRRPRSPTGCTPRSPTSWTRSRPQRWSVRLSVRSAGRWRGCFAGKTTRTWCASDYSVRRPLPCGRGRDPVATSESLSRRARRT